MKETVVIVAGGHPSLWPNMENFKKNHCFWIGVDRGSLYLLEHGIMPHMAVGDFDSLSEEELKIVQQEVTDIHYSLPEKDNTDTELALQLAIEKKPNAEFLLIGMTGGRLDHLLSNLWLPLEKRFQPYISQIQLLDNQNTVTYFLPGNYQIEKEVGKKYVGFICLTPVRSLSLYDAKYKLEKENVQIPFSYASNEFVGKTISFSFHAGVIAVIQSMDK